MTFLVVLHILICVFLIAMILIQPGKADGGGMTFGSSAQSIFGSKGAGNFLTKVTSVCAILFLITSFILTRSRNLEATKTVMPMTSEQEQAAPAAPVAPTEKPAAPKK